MQTGLVRRTAELPEILLRVDLDNRFSALLLLIGLAKRFKQAWYANSNERSQATRVVACSLDTRLDVRQVLADLLIEFLER